MEIEKVGLAGRPVRQCSLKLRNLTVGESDKSDKSESDDSSSSDDELPSLPFEIKPSTSQAKCSMSIKELLEQQKNLAKDIKGDIMYQSNVDEKLKKLEETPHVEVADELSSDEQNVETLYNIFCVNDSMQFFNSRDVTPLLCGYDNRSEEMTKLEKEILSFVRVDLEHAMSSVILACHTCFISDCKSFVTFLLRNISVFPDAACVNACYHRLISILNEYPDVKSLTFSSAEIFMLIFNYGIDTDSCEILLQRPTIKRHLGVPKYQSKCYNKIPDKWTYNLQVMLKALTKLISSCEFKPKDLCHIITFLMWMSLDSTLLRENFYSIIQECINVCLERIAEDKWKETLTDVASIILSMKFSPEEKLKNQYSMTESVPAVSPRSAFLRKQISFTVLKHLFPGDDVEQSPSELTIKELQSLLQNMLDSDMDSEELSLVAKFVDLCINHLDATKENYTELCNILKQAESSQKKSYVAAQFSKIHAKLKIMSGQDSINKVAAWSDGGFYSRLKIKKENVEGESGEMEFEKSSISEIIRIKTEPATSLNDTSTPLVHSNVSCKFEQDFAENFPMTNSNSDELNSGFPVIAFYQSEGIEKNCDKSFDASATPVHSDVSPKFELGFSETLPTANNCNSDQFHGKLPVIAYYSSEDAGQNCDQSDLDNSFCPTIVNCQSHVIDNDNNVNSYIPNNLSANEQMNVEMPSIDETEVPMFCDNIRMVVKDEQMSTMKEFESVESFKHLHSNESTVTLVAEHPLDHNSDSNTDMSSANDIPVELFVTPKKCMTLDLSDVNKPSSVLDPIINIPVSKNLVNSSEPEEDAELLSNMPCYTFPSQDIAENIGSSEYAEVYDYVLASYDKKLNSALTCHDLNSNEMMEEPNEVIFIEEVDSQNNTNTSSSHHASVNSQSNIACVDDEIMIIKEVESPCKNNPNFKKFGNNVTKVQTSKTKEVSAKVSTHHIKGVKISNKSNLYTDISNGNDPDIVFLEEVESPKNSPDFKKCLASNKNSKKDKIAIMKVQSPVQNNVIVRNIMQKTVLETTDTSEILVYSNNVEKMSVGNEKMHIQSPVHKSGNVKNSKLRTILETTDTSEILVYSNEVEKRSETNERIKSVDVKYVKQRTVLETTDTSDILVYSNEVEKEFVENEIIQDNISVNRNDGLILMRENYLEPEYYSPFESPLVSMAEASKHPPVSMVEVSENPLVSMEDSESPQVNMAESPLVNMVVGASKNPQVNMIEVSKSPLPNIVIEASENSQVNMIIEELLKDVNNICDKNSEIKQRPFENTLLESTEQNDVVSVSDLLINLVSSVEEMTSDSHAKAADISMCHTPISNSMFTSVIDNVGATNSPNFSSSSMLCINTDFNLEDSNLQLEKENEMCVKKPMIIHIKETVREKSVDKIPLIASNRVKHRFSSPKKLTDANKEKSFSYIKRPTQNKSPKRPILSISNENKATSQNVIPINNIQTNVLSKGPCSNTLKRKRPESLASSKIPKSSDSKQSENTNIGRNKHSKSAGYIFKPFLPSTPTKKKQKSFRKSLNKFSPKKQYTGLRKTTHVSALSKTGLNLARYIRNKMGPSLSSKQYIKSKPKPTKKPEIWTLGSDSDVEELYCDPKRYADKDCMIVYESIDQIVLD